MKKIVIFCLVLLMTLSGCNLANSATPTLNPQTVATQVALLLTQITSTSPTNNIPSTPIANTEVASTPSLQWTATSTITETITPTLTFTSTQTESPTATVLPDIKSTLGTPTWQNPANWKGFYFIDNDPEVNITESNNNLVLTTVHAEGWHGWSLSYIKGLDFYLEGTFKVGACSGTDRYGLVFRAPTTSVGYFLGLTCDGQYALRTLTSSGFTETNVIDWTQSPDILSGANQVNRLGVMAKGNQYSIYINGKLQGTATDDTYKTQGIFGVFIASSNTIGFKVSVQELDFWDLP
jgi:hypothetical protein